MKRGILIGIAGGSGSGKTLVADTIFEELGPRKVVIVRQDSYYKDLKGVPWEERVKRNYDHPDAFDSELLTSHLRHLLSGEQVEQPIYDFQAHARKEETLRIGGKSIIVLEGILILDDPALRELMDIKVYIDTDPDVRLIRRLKRDTAERGRSVEAVVTQYEETVRPMHMQFVEPSKRYADIIIPEGGYNLVAIDLLKVKIEHFLREREIEERRG
ncbi:MAG: uridine kinase [Candidatus Eisenbacteria bacterium]|nr:uridine kinase [Candidatus Eisenbacteria bacterium]